MDTTQATIWLDSESIERVEVLMPDLAGIGRGKLIPRDQFLDDWRSGNLRLPNVIQKILDHVHQQQAPPRQPPRRATGPITSEIQFDAS